MLSTFLSLFTTTLLLRRYFDLTSNIGSQFAASLLDQLLASQPKNPETIEQDKAEREQIITRATTAATKAGYAEGTKEGVEDEATAIRLGKIAGKYFKRKRACIAYMESTCRLTFLFLLPLSNLFQCLCRDHLSLKHPNKSFLTQ